MVSERLKAHLDRAVEDSNDSHARIRLGDAAGAAHARLGDMLRRIDRERDTITVEMIEEEIRELKDWLCDCRSTRRSGRSRTGRRKDMSRGRAVPVDLQHGHW